MKKLISIIILSVSLFGCGGGSGSDNTPPPQEVQNRAPVANAGNDQNAATGTVVTLNGSASSDVDGDTVSYAWSLTTLPTGSSAVLTDPTNVSPTFTVDIDGTYVAQLIVNDGTVSSAADTISVVAASANSAPVANAGNDQNAATGTVVTLNGRASSDVDGDTVSYAWSLTTLPTGSSAVLTNPTNVSPTFTVDIDGTYVAQLIVNDGTVSSAADTISVVAPTPAVQEAPVLKTFWTFAVHVEPIAVHSGRDYPSFANDFYAEDFNGDGHVDIIVGGPTWIIGDNGESSWSNRPFEMEVLRGTVGGFVIDPAMLFGNNPINDMIHLTDIQAGDFDGDGLTDLVFSGNGLDSVDSAGDRVYYYRNTGTLPLVDSSADLDYGLRSFFHSAAMGDFDGDGFTDLTFWQSQFGGTIELSDTTGVVVKGNGAGEFVRDRAIVPAEFAPEYFTENQGGEWGVSDVGAFNLNNSGCDDLVLGALSVHHGSMVLFNHCDGEFSKPALNRDDVQADTFVLPIVEGYERVVGVAEYALDDDEWIDLAVVRTGDYFGDDYVGNYIQFLRNNGDQTFTDVTDDIVTQSAGPKWLNKVHVHDFDGDGYMDMVFTVDNPFDDENITDVIWRGTPTGLEQVELDFEDVHGSLIIADVDSDGNLDILVRRVLNFGRDNQRIEYRLLENITE